MVTQNAHNRTVGEMRRLIFPNGTCEVESGSRSWSNAPVFASDIFAFCAYLIQITGLMGYFDPNPEGQKSFPKGQPLRVTLSRAEREKCQEASEAWRQTNFENPIPPALITELWAIVDKEQSARIHVRKVQKDHKSGSLLPDSTPPKWWAAIFKLLIIADEACAGIGHYYRGPSNEGDDDPAELRRRSNVPDLRLFDLRLKQSRSKPAGSTVMYAVEQQVSSMCYYADKHIVCVQPKGRVTQVGCSSRNLSRNLSLTGPAGGVRCSWQQLAADVADDQLRKALNILLIPLPLVINANAFCELTPVADKWGSFAINQHWLPSKVESDGYDHDVVQQKQFIDDIVAIIRKAQTDAGQVDAIVFPELSLTYPIFKALFEELIKDGGHAQSLHFMIAGAANNCEKDTGNFVLTAVRERSTSTDSTTDLGKDIGVYSQRKHHRWRLTEDQIATYGLGATLTPAKAWWEEHLIESRELNFFQFRRDTVFASLICEDLARNDPCLDIMRSVAPNLIFALLMDGPQIANRWSARYAGSLADDPGSTVITLTSFGLIERSNFQFSDTKSRSIGFIRDGEGVGREIILPEKHSAVLLTLGSKKVTDYTIDGRPTTNASSWRYLSQRPIAESPFKQHPILRPKAPAPDDP